MKMKLSFWRNLLEEPLESRHKELAYNWKTCAVGERIQKEGKCAKKIEDLSPELKVLGYDFFLAVGNKKKQRASEILSMIEDAPSIWKNQKTFQKKLRIWKKYN